MIKTILIPIILLFSACTPEDYYYQTNYSTQIEDILIEHKICESRKECRENKKISTTKGISVGIYGEHAGGGISSEQYININTTLTQETIEEIYSTMQQLKEENQLDYKHVGCVTVLNNNKEITQKLCVKTPENNKNY